MDVEKLTSIANLSNTKGKNVEILTWSKNLYVIQQFNELDRFNKLFEFLDNKNQYISLSWDDIAAYRLI